MFKNDTKHDQCKWKWLIGDSPGYSMNIITSWRDSAVSLTLCKTKANRQPELECDQTCIMWGCALSLMHESHPIQSLWRETLFLQFASVMNHSVGFGSDRFLKWATASVMMCEDGIFCSGDSGQGTEQQEASQDYGGSHIHIR